MWESWDSNNYDYNKDGEGSIFLAAGRPRPQGLSGLCLRLYPIPISPPQGRGPGQPQGNQPPAGAGSYP